ncbi:hypothetical protein ACJJI3_01870 [Microbulbifer sp. ZKSA004]|uniref:hypothetical protein n=1 Tax=Microbulbifer sp. ZKSA004 TaxID=3243389 RepID=UPI00403A0A34
MGKVKRHVLARIELCNDVDSPKTNGVRSGYNPHHKFDGISFLVSGMHSYGDDEKHFPGEVINANINFASWEHIKEDVKVGDVFLIQELDRVVGKGVILEIDEGE